MVEVEVEEVLFGLAWKALNPVQSVRNGRDYGVSQQGRYKAARVAKNCGKLVHVSKLERLTP